MERRAHTDTHTHRVEAATCSIDSLCAHCFPRNTNWASNSAFSTTHDALLRSAGKQCYISRQCKNVCPSWACRLTLQLLSTGASLCCCRDVGGCSRSLAESKNTANAQYDAAASGTRRLFKDQEKTAANVSNSGDSENFDSNLFIMTIWCFDVFGFWQSFCCSFRVKVLLIHSDNI